MHMDTCQTAFKAAEDRDIKKFVSEPKLNGNPSFRILKAVHFLSGEPLGSQILGEDIVGKSNRKEVDDWAHGRTASVLVKCDGFGRRALPFSFVKANCDLEN